MAGEDLYNVKGDQEHIDEKVRNIVCGVHHERDDGEPRPHRGPELVAGHASVSFEVLARIRPRVVLLD